MVCRGSSLCIQLRPTGWSLGPGAVSNSNSNSNNNGSSSGNSNNNGRGQKHCLPCVLIVHSFTHKPAVVGTSNNNSSSDTSRSRITWLEFWLHGSSIHKHVARAALRRKPWGQVQDPI